jgi:hypothetical protein
MSGGTAVVRSIVETEGTGRSRRYSPRLLRNLGETTATVPERVRGGNADDAGEVLRVSDRLISALDRLESLYLDEITVRAAEETVIDAVFPVKRRRFLERYPLSCQVIVPLVHSLRNEREDDIRLSSVVGRSRLVSPADTEITVAAYPVDAAISLI